MPDRPINSDKDYAEFTIRFYLYQTEIKVQVEVDGQVKIYTGSYKRKSIPFLGSVNDSESDLNVDDLNIGTNKEASFGLQGIEASYAEETQPAIAPENEEEIGLQGVITPL